VGCGRAQAEQRLVTRDNVTMKPVFARAYRCADEWVVDVASLGLRLRARDLDGIDVQVGLMLGRQNRSARAEPVRVHITHYLHLDDCPPDRRRTISNVLGIAAEPAKTG
jgi:hypothetical protein